MLLYGRCDPPSLWSELSVGCGERAGGRVRLLRLLHLRHVDGSGLLLRRVRRCRCRGSGLGLLLCGRGRRGHRDRGTRSPLRRRRGRQGRLHELQNLTVHDRVGALELVHRPLERLVVRQEQVRPGLEPEQLLRSPDVHVRLRVSPLAEQPQLLRSPLRSRELLVRVLLVRVRHRVLRSRVRVRRRPLTHLLVPVLLRLLRLLPLRHEPEEKREQREQRDEGEEDEDGGRSDESLAVREAVGVELEGLVGRESSTCQPADDDEQVVQYGEGFHDNPFQGYSGGSRMFLIFIIIRFDPS